MQSVELVRAEPGAQKVSCTTTLQEHCGLGLADAKHVTASSGLLKPAIAPIEHGPATSTRPFVDGTASCSRRLTKPPWFLCPETGN